ncbi:MAG: nuclear transport factor 2 family protein [Roseiflexaceae bacterium]|nr:nuclear transport factor 2 family protein [Roseiflexaceae bacterium]
MNDAMHDFETFMQRRLDASRAFVNGDAGSLDGIATHTSPATIFGPQGDYVEGADAVNAANARSAQFFEPDSTSDFEILHMSANDGLAYWAGIQRATVRMHGQSAAIPMDLRVTEVFRREGDAWKLVHRHADTLAPESEEHTT